MSAITRTLASFAAELPFEQLPQAVAARTEALVMDQFGIALRARNEAELRTSLAAALSRLGLGGGEATVIGDGAGYTPPAAAFFNGNLGHCLDFDDTHARGSIHASAPIVPAALAAAEMTGASGRDLVAGIVAGYEVQIRLSLALGPTDHYRRGFHPTATCGVFGAAAAAGRVFGLETRQMEHALGLCGSQAAGSMQWLIDSSWNKAFHTGYAAMSGLISASFAREGFRGALEAIEGESGFLRAYAPNPDPEKAVEGIGGRWETLEIAVKPYPSCRYGHAAMDALISLRERHRLAAADIRRVEIGLPETGWNLIGNREEERRNPASYVDGQFSMPFVAAVALRDGGMTWDSYAKHLGDDETLSLCRRVSSHVDADVEAEYPAKMAGSARVFTDHGEHYEIVRIAKGEPENFLSDEEMRTKFDGLVRPYLDEASRDELAAGLLTLHESDDVRQLMRLARPRPAQPLRVASRAD